MIPPDPAAGQNVPFYNLTVYSSDPPNTGPRGPRIEPSVTDVACNRPAPGTLPYRTLAAAGKEGTLVMASRSPRASIHSLRRPTDAGLSCSVHRLLRHLLSVRRPRSDVLLGERAAEHLQRAVRAGAHLQLELGPAAGVGPGQSHRQRVQLRRLRAVPAPSSAAAGEHRPRWQPITAKSVVVEWGPGGAHR